MKIVVSLKSYGAQHLIGVRYVTLFVNFKFDLLSQIYISSQNFSVDFFCVVTYLNAIFRELKSSIMYQKNAQLKIIAIHKFVETCPSAIICGMKIGNVQNAVKEIDAITMLL